ncbi:hypothetical protein FRC10_007194 [Ceratobasidium sp. 414]|nr:hypothetical protein FRC10_007194 [Ceratobasidium sp. 414]
MLPKTVVTAFTGISAVAFLVNGHPGEIHHPLSPVEISRRQLAASRRHIVARNCASQIAEFNAKRKAKREALMKHGTQLPSTGENGNSHNGKQSPPPTPSGHSAGGYWHWHAAPGHGHSASGHGRFSSRHGHPHPTHSGTKVCSTHSATSPSATGVGAAVTGASTTVIATVVSSSTDVIGTSTSSANAPTYTTLQNSTCVTAPEVTEGPYYVANELLRNDLRETQAGVDLLLDIGVIDVTTCQPLENALVEIWNCNATGQYSGFTTAQTSGGAGGNGTQGMTMSMSPSGSAPTDTVSMPVNSGSMPPANATGSGSMGAAPTGGAGGTSGSTSMTDQETFLRGGAATGAGGVVEFKTIYPGFYTGRTVHIHTMIQTNYTIASNGSIISHAGQIHHVGQIFFDEAMNTQVLAQPAYVNTTQTRTLNADDSIMAEENTDGFNAIAE